MDERNTWANADTFDTFSAQGKVEFLLKLFRTTSTITEAALARIRQDLFVFQRVAELREKVLSRNITYIFPVTLRELADLSQWIEASVCQLEETLSTELEGYQSISALPQKATDAITSVEGNLNSLKAAASKGTDKDIVPPKAD